MSLFICGECGCVENSNLVGKIVNEDSDYPNLHIMNMINFKVMRCSLCNTGIWHGEFKRYFADEDLKKIANLSEVNMITPYDQPSGSLVRVGHNDKVIGLDIPFKIPESCYGYTFSVEYLLFAYLVLYKEDGIKLEEELYDLKVYEKFKDNDLYVMYTEDMFDFELDGILYLLELNKPFKDITEYEIVKAMMMSIKNGKSKSKRFNSVMGMHKQKSLFRTLGIDFFNNTKITKERKAMTKEDIERLEKAKLKRKKKAIKKRLQELHQNKKT